MTSICNEFFLVSCKEARNDSPYVTQINDTAAFIWKQICKEKSLDEIIDSIKNEFEIVESEEIERIIKDFINLLLENKLIILESENKQK